MILQSSRKAGRGATAAVEFAVCLPLVLLLLAGLLEVGRIVEVEQVMINGCREACRDASLAQVSLAPYDTSGNFSASGWPSSGSANPGNSIAYNTLLYLQNAEPVGRAFGQSHTTSIKTAASAGVTIPSGFTGFTVWDNTANQELFTIMYEDVTTPSVIDPTGPSPNSGPSQLDHFKLGISVPYSLVSVSPISSIMGTTRLSVTLDWVSMVDSPFQVVPVLPAQ
jgi:Flp pilus assembly protein TadG